MLPAPGVASSHRLIPLLRLRALLRPVLRSLSRPSSPALSLVAPRSPAPSSPTKGSPGLPFPDAELADRSASSLPAQFPPREPTDPAPTVESQGFVLYIGSLVAYVAYLVWAFLPEEWLEAIGIEWYPARYVRGDLPAPLGAQEPEDYIAETGHCLYRPGSSCWSYTSTPATLP